MKQKEKLQRQEFAEKQRKLEMKKKVMMEETKMRESELLNQKAFQEKIMLLKRESNGKEKEIDAPASRVNRIFLIIPHFEICKNSELDLFATTDRGSWLAMSHGSPRRIVVQ